MNCIFRFIKENIPKIHPKKHVMLITRKCNDTVDRRCCLLVHIIKKTLDMFAYQHLLKGIRFIVQSQFQKSWDTHTDELE